MTTPSSSLDRVRMVYAGYAGLYAPSVATEAAALLDDLLDTAAQYGHDHQAEATGWLVTAAAEATSTKYGRPAVERTITELAELSRALNTALTREGLTLTLARGGSNSAVEPLSGGPTWGLDGRTGLAVGIYLNSGWDLAVNQGRSTVHSIYAPATADGAREVAVIVRDILLGKAEDPFRPSR
ncbi:hypothetical protein ACIBEA_40260 [Streptomyces sp. NPDC051555]|uniref:hypothetical protein n=1 Tax=Streptomyces sp. NPDC051555 TaxID=3365657 RepID=UPI00379DF9D4